MSDDQRQGMLPECRQALDSIHGELSLIRKAVIGNGENGLIQRVAGHATALKIIGAATAIIAAAVLATRL